MRRWEVEKNMVLVCLEEIESGIQNSGRSNRASLIQDRRRVKYCTNLYNRGDVFVRLNNDPTITQSYKPKWIYSMAGHTILLKTIW